MDGTIGGLFLVSFIFCLSFLPQSHTQTPHTDAYDIIKLDLSTYIMQKDNNISDLI